MIDATTLTIRDATLDDLSTVHTITQAAYEQIKSIIGEQAHVFGETMNDLTQRMADGWTILVAERNGQIMGTVRVGQHEGELYVGRLAVLPDAHRAGVGQHRWWRRRSSGGVNLSCQGRGWVPTKMSPSAVLTTSGWATMPTSAWRCEARRGATFWVMRKKL